MEGGKRGSLCSAECLLQTCQEPGVLHTPAHTRRPAGSGHGIEPVGVAEAEKQEDEVRNGGRQAWMREKQEAAKELT